MPLTLVVLTAWAVMFLAANVYVSVRVWRMHGLPTWRRTLPAVLLCAALAASLSRATGTTAIAATIAFPLNVATLLVGCVEIRRHRRTAAAGIPNGTVR